MGNIAEGKKRYYLTLTESNMVQFKEALSSFGATPGTESILIDLYISGMVKLMMPTIKRIHESGKQPTFADFMVMAGTVMQELQDDQLKL